MAWLRIQGLHRVQNVSDNNIVIITLQLVLLC